MSSNDLLANAVPEAQDPHATSSDLLAPGRREPQFDAADSATADVLGDGLPAGFMHPNEMDDEPEMLGSANSPFSPLSPEFGLDLREEDVVEPIVTVPGVEPRKPSILLSPQEREASLKALLEDEMEGDADSGPVILEFGPLAALEKRLRDVTRDFADPDLAAVVTTRVRRCIHEAVVSNTLLGEKESTEAGLMARIEAVADLETAMEDKVEPLLARIEELGLDLDPLRTALKNTVEVETRRLDNMTKSLVPATIGTALFEGLRDVTDSIAKKFSGKEELVGDVRRHRNEQLTRQLAQLVEVSYELRTKSGDEQWELGEGAMAASVANELSNSIANLTKGVEDQVDFSVLNKGLGDASRNMTEAADAAATDEHKNRLEKMVAFVKNVVEAISNAVKRVLGNDAKDSNGAKRGPSYAPT